MVNGYQRTPCLVAQYNDLQDEKRAITEELRELRIQLTSKGILSRYNEVIQSFENTILQKLDERAQLYRERDDLDNQTKVRYVEAHTQQHLELPTLTPPPTEKIRLDPLDKNENKNTNKTINKNKKAEKYLRPKTNVERWKHLQSTTTTKNYLYHKEQVKASIPNKRNISLQDQCDANKTTRQGRFCRQTATPLSTHAVQKWLPIPERLKAFPSIFEQIHNSHKLLSIEGKQSSNYFAPLEPYLNDMSNEDLIDLARIARTDINNEMVDVQEDEGCRQPTSENTQQSTVVTAGVDDLDQILGLAQIPIEEVQLSPPVSAHLTKSSPFAITKVTMDITMRNCSKNQDKNERVVKLWSVAKKFDKQVVLCPIVNEPLPVLRNDNEIRTCLLYQYFQDRVPARKQQVSYLQGFVTFGITIEENEFLAAMKDWAISYGHDVARTDKTSTTVVAGFLTHMSITTNKTVAEDQLKRTRTYSLLGKPRIYLRVSTVYGKSINGGPDRAPAWCVECAREDIDTVVKLCETVFTGNNKQLASCIRRAVYLPTRSLPVGHPTRQSYIVSQLAYLNSELTVTCHGLADIYNMVRLRQDPTIQTSLEDVLMSVPAVTGKLFRNIDVAVADGTKAFLKLDEINMPSWLHRRNELSLLIQSIILPEDHCRAFSTDDKTLTFSDPWRKIKDGKPSRNVFDIPNASSLAYAESMLKKLPSYEVTVPAVKKRMHSGRKSGSSNLQEVDLTGEDTSVSSPNHKVQVVEQRAGTRQISSETEILMQQSAHTAPKSRLELLEDVVADHGQQLVEIKTSVTNLDGKIHRNHEETKFAFQDFRSVLLEIKGAMNGNADTPKGSIVQADGGSPASEHTGISECYNPITEKVMWQNKITAHESALRAARTNRAAYEQVLAREGSDGAIDYRQVAYQRYPSPVMEDVPDDLTLYY